MRNQTNNSITWVKWYTELQAIALKHRVSVADGDSWMGPWEEGQSAEDAFYEEHQDLREKADEACVHKQHNRPCRECPWRKESMPGWLGASQPGEFLQQSDQGHRMPCHLAVNYDSPNWEKQAKTAPQCAGHAIFLSNRCKSPAPGVLKLPADREEVFTWPHEFVAHHAGLPEGSLAGVMVYELYGVERSPTPSFKRPGTKASKSTAE